MISICVAEVAGDDASTDAEIAELDLGPVSGRIDEFLPLPAYHSVLACSIVDIIIIDGLS